MTTKSDLVFIIGRERSGTTVFRNLLKRSGAIDCDEILHGDLSRRYRFYRYLQDRLQDDPSLIHPRKHPKVFREYIEELRVQAQGRPLAMDVKYFALNLIPAHEATAGQSPFLFNFMRNNNAHVVHIIRKNKLRVFISQEIARATGKWSAEKPEQLPRNKPRINVNPQQALNFIGRLIKQDEAIANILRDIPGVHRLIYEEMFLDNGNFSDKTIEVAEACLEKTIEDNRPGNLRMNPDPIAHLVENYNEIHKAISVTQYAWMV